MLGGDLRIGLREGLLEAAIAKAFDRPLDDVKWAGMLTGDVGRLASLARDDRLADAEMTVFHPLKFMLASPAEDAAEIIRRLGPEVWVEDKYDGIRAQLHKRGSEVRLFSRDLHDVTSQFPEIAEAATDLAWDGILDGEILGWKDGVVLPFVSLQARLGRKTPSAAIQAEVPVIFVAFDALALGPGGGAPIEPLLRTPLTERRRRLEAIDLPLAGDGGRFARSTLAVAADAEALEAAFLDARGRRNEGLMVKDPESGYSPGRRGLGWLKMKKALATIDCVVVGVEVGHGKRHGVLSDYTFAVRDTAQDRLVTIGKAYSGLTDAEIAEMTRWFEAHTVAQYGRYRQVEPTVVVEIGFDVILRSNRHKSGFSLRFPRIVAAAARQVTRRDRHGRDRDRALRRAPAGSRAAGHCERPQGLRPAPGPYLGGTALPVDREVQPVAPLRPAAVVHRDVLVAEQRQHPRELGGRDPRRVVADHPAAAAHVRGVELAAQLRPVAEPLLSRPAHRAHGDVERARDVAEALGVALEALVVGRRPRVEQHHVGRAQQAAHVGRRQSDPAGTAQIEARPRRHPDLGVRHRMAVGDPGRVAAVEDPHRLRARRPAGSTRPAPRTGPGCRRRPRRSCRWRSRAGPRAPPSCPVPRAGSSRRETRRR